MDPHANIFKSLSKFLLKLVHEHFYKLFITNISTFQNLSLKTVKVGWDNQKLKVNKLYFSVSEVAVLDRVNV